MKLTRQLAYVVALAALAAPSVFAQKSENLPKFLRIVEAGNVEVRFLDFKWDAEAFEALANGTAADRSWVLARIFTPEPLELNGKQVPGGALLILNPTNGATPMTLEVRVIDMREVLTDPNVVAEPPDGQTVYKEPAQFETVEAMAERLDIGLAEADGTYTLSVHYGNQRAVIVAGRE